MHFFLAWHLVLGRFTLVSWEFVLLHDLILKYISSYILIFFDKNQNFILSQNSVFQIKQSTCEIFSVIGQMSKEILSWPLCRLKELLIRYKD